MKAVKVEIVADNFVDMANQLGALAEIYRYGANLQSTVFVDPPKCDAAAVQAPKERKKRTPKTEVVADTPAPKDLTEAEVRAAMIDYVNLAAKQLDKPRQEIFTNDLLHVFAVSKLVDLPAEKYPAMIAFIAEKTAALNG